MTTSSLLRVKKQEEMVVTQAEEEQDIHSVEWFHPFVTRHIAESMLLANGKDGTYLVRNSSNDGEFVISIRCRDSVKHFPLTVQDGCYKFGMGSFKTMPDLVEHFANQPLIGSESGVLTILKYPYPRNVDEPAGCYDTVKVHAEFGKKIAKETPSEKPEFTVASKEGFLTKQGYYIKNWKTRWFVLQKYELRYFKEREDKEALKVLDLHLCTGCEPVDYENKDNCFRIVFQHRIFYIYAATKQEMKEWVDLIAWKLKILMKERQKNTEEEKKVKGTSL